jgi:signal transduction histidine kinase
LATNIIEAVSLF